jgi:hypothetical protein
LRPLGWTRVDEVAARSRAVRGQRPLRIFALPGLDQEKGNRAGRIRLLSPLRVFLPIKDQLTVRLEGCDQHYAMLKRNLLYTG